MHVSRVRAGLVALAVAASGIALATPASAGDDIDGRSPTPVQRDGRKVRAEAVHLHSSTGLEARPNAGNTGPSHYTPPPCWYQPATAAEYLDFLTTYRSTIHHTGDDTVPEIMADFKKMMEEYQKHSDETEGSWYTITCDDWAAPEVADWLTKPLWVWANPAEGIPVPPGAIDPHELAEYARASMVLPELKPVLSPNPPLRSVVNLPTWAYVAQAEPEDMIAEVPGMEVRVLATPVAMRLSSNAPTDYIPGSRSCPSHGGSFGTPYRKGAQPECAVIFRKASVDASGGFELETTVTWQITWTLNGAPGAPALDPADISATSQVPVEEIQTVVTPGG
jgi:hypothetical protein